MTPQQLDNFFTYHKPTEDTFPKYTVIRDAEKSCHLFFAKLSDPKLFLPERDELLTSDCDTVNKVTRYFAETIEEIVPDSNDKDAAIRCVRLARNAANEYIMSQVIGFPFYIDNLEEGRRQLVLARWQANSAIACS